MIGLIGINHQIATLDKRSAFALSSAESSLIVEDWIACGFVRGAVILSTCNRVEIYYDVETSCPKAVEQRLIHSILQNLELSPKYASLLMTKWDVAVYEHLFRLASGLESIVVGETQILGQLKEAYRMASLAGHCPGSLSRLFHRAFEVAKRVRSEYILNSAPISAGSAAVDKLFANTDTPLGSILIIGAGIMADVVYERLRSYPSDDIVVYNRTRERAERFQVEHPLARIAYEGSLESEIIRADAIVVATSAPSPIVLVEHVLPEYGAKCIVDLAVPRNVSTEVDSLEHITLYTIDELADTGQSIDSVTNERISAIIDEYVNLHQKWVEGAHMREAIAEIQRATKLLRDKELDTYRGMLTEDEEAFLSKHSEHFRTTMATALVAALKELTNDGRQHRSIDAIRRIFAEVCNRLQ